MSLGALFSLPMKTRTDEEFEKFKQNTNQYNFYYPIGNCRPLDVTHGCKIPTPCDVMLLGCGDIRYLLHTLQELHARLGEKKKKPVLNFHLNDIEDGILCRNLIFLYLLDTIDPENDADIKFLWSVWNEALLNKDHHTRLQSVLNTLEDVQSGDYGVYFGSDWTREKLILGMKWFGKQRIRPQTIKEDRKNFFLESYDTSEFPMKPTLRVASKFTMQHEMFDDTRLKDRLAAEILEYVEFGTTRNNTGRRRRRDLERDFHGNQTLYRPRSEEWKSQDNCSPFMCYNVDYELPRYDGVNTTMASLFLEKLQSWVKTYQKVKSDGWKVKITLWLGDCVELCDVGLPDSLQFDFIHTSNLSDRLGIVPLLVHCQGRLKRDDGLVTIESYQWARMNNIVVNTLKFCVDIPLPMYPTVVGLHLVDDLDIGHERLLENGMFVGCSSLILTWKVARQPSSIQITGSDDVSKSIKGMVRLNTEQKDNVGPFGFQGAELTKFDIEGRNKLIQRLRGFINGGGKQISKVISDFLMGSVPGSLKFLTEENDSVVDTEEPSSDKDFQLNMVEFVDRYEVTLTSDPSLMQGQFSCDHKDENKDIVIFMFKENSTVHLKKTVSFSCSVVLTQCKIQVARKRGTVSCVIIKHMGFVNSEMLMPRDEISQKVISKLPDFPQTSFGHDLLAMYLFRMYPVQDKEPVEGREDIEYDEQVQRLTEFLMMTYLDSGKKKKVFGLPTATGKDNILGRWSSIFRVEGLKIWEGKPSLFVTWYYVDMARMLILDRLVTIQEVVDVVKMLKPEETFNEFHKYHKGFQQFDRTLETNGYRLQQTDGENRWIIRTFVRPRYRHLPFEAYQSEVNLVNKFGKCPTDPRDVKAHMKKMFAANPMASKMNFGDTELEEIYKRTMKLMNPGFSGYGSPNVFSDPNSTTPHATGSGKPTSGDNTSSPEVDKCDGCGKVSPQGKKCTGCKSVIYCDRDCQRKAWPRHKLVCKK